MLRPGSNIGPPDSRDNVLTTRPPHVKLKVRWSSPLLIAMRGFDGKIALSYGGFELAPGVVVELCCG